MSHSDRVKRRKKQTPEEKAAEDAAAVEASTPSLAPPEMHPARALSKARKQAPISAIVVEQDGDFEAMFEASEAGKDSQERFHLGDAVTGYVEVISLTGSEVFLDLGGKSNGFVLKEELLDGDGNLTVKPGDSVQGVVSHISPQGIQIRTRVSAGSGSMADLESARDAGLPVEGKVTGINKGGFEVQVGKVSAFCPLSQIDLYRSSDPESYVGQTLAFKVVELRDRNVVLSRFELLREERAERAEEVRKTLVEGARVSGRVSRIKDFGVFVDLGGIDGLIHVSELSWDRVEDPASVVDVGQEVEVVILEVDTARDRIALSLRRTTEDPLEEAMGGLILGQDVNGPVVRITSFGSFVNIGPGVDGLIHISELAHHRVRSAADVVSVGDHVRARIVSVDLDRRRIGLSLKSTTDDPWDEAGNQYAPGTTVAGEVVRIERFGAFIQLPTGLVALLPAQEAALPPGRAIAAAFRLGQQVEARVLRVDTKERKIALTRRKDADADSGPRAWKDPGGDHAPAVGTFGALLAEALQDDDA